MFRLFFATALLVLCSTRAALATGTALSRFEARHLHAIDLTPDGSRLLVLNAPDARLSVFDVSAGGNTAPALLSEIPVGLEPVTVRARTNSEAWVVNELSDSVSIVDLVRGVVVATLPASDEPADVIFAAGKAFVSCARNNLIRVFDPVTRAVIGEIPLDGVMPRALAIDDRGSRLYVAFLLSGNHTTTLPAELSPNPPAPTNPSLPPAPKTGMIVSAEDARLGFTVREIDVAEINVSTLAVERTFLNVGTNLHDLAVQPGTGDVWVASTEALNLVRFEPALRGHPLENRLSRITAAGVVSTFDLNPGLDYTLLPNPTARATALAIPMAVSFAPHGGHLWVAAFGSDYLAKVDMNGGVLQKVNLRPNVTPGEIGTPEMRGPRSLRMDALGRRLYVFNKLSATVAIVETGGGTVVTEFPAGSYDPTPERLSLGRKFFSDARLSGNGTASCASCHPDADRDGIAWDLGDPGGEMFITTGTNLGNNVIRTRELHPMKGPMVTQTLWGIAGMGDFHWRGDKKDIRDFNPTFNKLLGGAQLAAGDMDVLTEYLESLRLHPNPNRTLENGLPQTIHDGDPVRGKQFFTTYKGNCAECHALPVTTNHNIDMHREVGSPQPVKNASLRTVYQKVFFDGRAGAVSRSGYGLNHLGTGFKLPFGHPYVLDSLANVQELNDVTAFVLCVETGTVPAVGQSLTFSTANRTDALLAQQLTVLESSTASGQSGLVLRGVVGGRGRAFRFDAGLGKYVPDGNGVPALTRTELLGSLGEGDAVTATGVLPEDAPRLGGDRDSDGLPDQDMPRPRLSIDREGSAAVRLQWTNTHTGWRVERATQPDGPWTPQPRRPQRTAQLFQYHDSLPGSQAFYRLQRTW